MYFRVCVWFTFCFLLGDKQEAKFGGVMSVQNIHVISAYLLCFSSILYINKSIIALYMIFGSFVHYKLIWWFSEALWRYEEEEVNTQHLRRNV